MGLGQSLPPRRWGMFDFGGLPGPLPSFPNSTISGPLGFEFGPDVRLGQQGGNPVSLLLPLVTYTLGQPGPPNTAVYAGVSTPQVVGNP